VRLVLVSAPVAGVLAGPVNENRMGGAGVIGAQTAVLALDLETVIIALGT
jgi:hypothetical protein